MLALAGIQGAAMLLGLDVLMRGLFRLLRLELGMDTLLVFAAAATLADALTMYRLDPRDGQMPYCAAIVLGIFFLLRGARRKRRGLRMACRTAASAAQPYLVTLDEGKWNGWDTYAKWSGEPIGFGRQMQAADGAERIFHRVCPLLFIACLLLSVVASIGRGAPERLLWCLSAMLTACASLSGALCFALPWLSLTQRLSKSGAAIAGWDGVTATGGSDGAGSWESAHRHDTLGFEVERILPGGIVRSFAYDDIGRLVDARTRKDSRTRHMRRYRWGVADRLLSVEDSRRGETRYSYTPAGQLERAEYPDGRERWRKSDQTGNLYPDRT